MSHATDLSSREAAPAIRLGLRPNLAQFSLLIVVNAFVGAMIGLERTILPAIAEQEFHLAARAAVPGPVRRVHSNYHIPISNTASGLLALEPA